MKSLRHKNDRRDIPPVAFKESVTNTHHITGTYCETSTDVSDCSGCAAVLNDDRPQSAHVDLGLPEANPAGGEQ